MENEEIKQLLRDAFREQNDKWNSYLDGGRIDIAKMQQSILHLESSVESLTAFVVRGNGEKGLIVSVPRMANDVEDLKKWKATAQKRENWLKLATVVIGGIGALILAWTQLQK